MSNPQETDSANSIAIVGLTCRFPGARNLEEFWENLRNGIESITYFTADELEAAGVDPALLRQPNYVRAAALLDGADLFDASFFGISPREAELIDPQHRIFLECAVEALENAGYDPDKYDGWIGVYGGAGFNSYLSNQLQSNRALMATMGYLQSLISNEKDYLTSRVSYKLNLKGPSVNVQTACSTGLVAVHLSCQSLLTYQCDMAIAGAVSVYSPPKSGYLYLEDGIQSPDGHTRSFDAQAQGTLFGSGVGVVVLKRLADARADGDTIHAVIKGTAINNDGSLKVGYTAPSVEGLSRVIAMALGNAEVKAETISYIEAHGTGTALGDPVELAALNKAFRSLRGKSACALGSVKTNFGHLNAAAGLAGLIKTVLALQHRQIPPSLHFNQPNPDADWEHSPFYINTRLTEWKLGKWPRRAGVNSMGIGGTNAHVVLEEAPEANASDPSAHWQLLLLSAKSEMALDNATERLAVHLERHPEQNLADVAYTLQVGRRDFAYRRMFVCNDTTNAVNALRSRQSQSVFTGRQTDQILPLVFLFPGQGAQYVNMGRDLYNAVPAFRRQIDQCVAFLGRHVDWDLRQVLYPPPRDEDESNERLRQTAIAQPALFAIEYSLATLLISWGIRPAAMVGHSIGEYVAACLAGVFTLEEGLALVSARGRLMQGVAAGSMLAVSVPATQLESLPLGTLSLAATNSANQCVVSGRDEAVTELERYLGQRGVDCRRLRTSHAFHSGMMDGILDAFHEEVRKVPLSEPQLPYLSNVTGKWVTAADATDASFWARHLRSPVRFAESVQTILGESEPAFVEVGPGQTLSSLVKQIAKKTPRPVVLPTLGHRQETEGEHECLLKTVGRLWLQGRQIDWKEYYGGEFRRRVPLPTYPFERQRFWVNAQRGASEREEAQKSLRKKVDVADWFYVPVWKGSVIPDFVSADHHEVPHACWLIFTDEFGLGSQLARRLEQEHFTVFTVKAGEHYARHSEKSFTINPRLAADYDKLLSEVSGLGWKLTHVVHAWCVTGSGDASGGEASFELMQSLGFYSLLQLVQSLGRYGGTEPLSIDVLTDDLQQVTGNEKLRPEKATVLGPCKVAPQEYQHFSMRSIDLSLPSRATTVEEKLLEVLVAEMCGGSEDPVVAYRNQRRWVQTFEQQRIEKSARATCLLRERGVYLITGGLGGIGLVLAEHLAKSIQARLVLVGRTSFPSRESWSSWLVDHGEADEISRRISKLQELESHGAQIIVESADVTDELQMQSMLDRVHSLFGQINGVIHAAGVAGGGIIQLKTETQAAGILASKVQGTRVLGKLFANGELDFMLLCSSRTAVLGGFGQVDYCAGNAFLDAFAYYNTTEKNVPTIAVDWDGWDDVGMRVNTASLYSVAGGAQSIEKGIAPHEGVDAFARILARIIAPQVVVSTKNLDASFERAGVLMQEQVMQEIEKLQSQREEPLHPRPNVHTPYVAPANELEQIIANIWQDLFSIERIGVDDDFFELGGNSLLGIQLNSRLREVFSIEIPLAHLFESPTVYGLAQVISRQLGQQEAPDAMAELLAELDGLSEEEAQQQLDSGVL